MNETKSNWFGAKWAALRASLKLEGWTARELLGALLAGLIWLAVLLPMPTGLRPVAEPYVLLGDTSIIGFFFADRSLAKRGK